MRLHVSDTAVPVGRIWRYVPVRSGEIVDGLQLSRHVAALPARFSLCDLSFE